jgi:hypothetical protein
MLALGIEYWYGHAKVHEHFILPGQHKVYGLTHLLLFVVPLLGNGINLSNGIGIIGVLALHALWEYQKDGWLSWMGYGRPDVIVGLMAQGDKRPETGVMELLISLSHQQWLGLGAHLLILVGYQLWLQISAGLQISGSLG